LKPMRKSTAKVQQINSTTKEIWEYEFQEGEGASKGGFLKEKLIFLIATVGISIAVVKLLGGF
jgi:hypothetical protein